MDREYDILERLPNGDIEWRGFVVGLEAARARLALLATYSTHELFALHTPTNHIAARVNAKDVTSVMGPRFFTTTAVPSASGRGAMWLQTSGSTRRAVGST